MLSTHLKTLARHAAIYGTADVFGTFINFLLLPIITRYLSPAEYGALGILLLFGVLTKILFRMGLDAGFFRLYYEQQTDRDRRVFTTTVLATAVAASTLLFLGAVLAAEPISRLLLGPGLETFIVLVAADTFLNTFAFVPMNLFRIEARAGYFAGVSAFRNTLNAGLKVALVLKGWGVAGILWSDVLSSALFVLALVPMLKRRVAWGFSWRMLREAASFGLPKVPHGLAYQVLNLSDRKLLDLFSTRAEVGLYHVGYMFGTGVKFFLSAFELAWSPFVYSLLKRDDAARTLARIATYASVVLFALGLAIAVFAREILALMTAPEFHAAYRVVPVVLLAYVLQGLFILTAIGIGISKKAYYYPVLTFSAATLNVGLNLLLIPRYGMMGAAWSTVAGYGLMTGLGIVFAQRHYPIAFEWRRMGLAAGAAFLSYAISLTAPEELLAALSVKLAALGVFPAGLYLLGFFRSDELTRLKALWVRVPSAAGEAPPSS